MKRNNLTKAKALQKTALCLILILTFFQLLHFYNTEPAHAELTTLQVYVEAASYARLDDIDPSGWFYQAVLYNPTSSPITVTGLRWWYNATAAKIIDTARNVRCYDKRYFTSLPTMYNPDDRTIYWEYAQGSINITVPAKTIILAWIEVPVCSVNNDAIATTYYVQAYAGSQWLSSPLYPSHTGHDSDATTLFRADFNLTTSPNSENQTHPNPEWLYNETRTVIANIPTRIRLIPITMSRNTQGIDYATVNITLPPDWRYTPNSASNPYGETITYYNENGKDKLKWDLTHDILKYATNTSMAQNYIEFNATPPYVPGLHNFTVTATVTSLSGRTATENQYIYTFVKTPPTANFTKLPTTPFAQENITLNATGSYDPDGTIANYFWDFGDGTNETSNNITTHAYAENETYTITLTITDDEGLNDTIQDTLTVQDRPPNATFTKSAQTILTGETISFNATESFDSDGTITSYFWDFGDGTNATDSFITHAYSDNGTYTITLTVTDNDGLKDTIQDTITVQNRLPTAQFTQSATTVYTGETILFNATQSFDQDGTITSYLWDFEDGTTAMGTTVNHTYVHSGTYTVRLNVTDNDGAINTTTYTVNILNRLPIASLIITPTRPTVGQTMTFNATDSHDPDGIIVKYIWNFGDGNTTETNSPVVTYAYDKEGAFNVTLTLVDNDGANRSITQAITISGQNNGASWPPKIEWSWLLFIIPPIPIIFGVVLWKRRRSGQDLKDFEYFKEITDGGIPDSFSVLITGEPGSGKSTLCQELAHSFLKEGKTCVYTTYDCFPNEVREDVKKFHPDVSEFEEKKKFLFIDCFSSIAKIKSEERYSLAQPFSLADLGIVMSQVTGEAGTSPKIFLDSVVPLLTHVDPSKVVEFLQDRSARIKGVNGTFIFTVGKETTEASLISRLEEFADCVIELETTQHEGKTIRRLHIKKMRGRKPSDKWIRFTIDQKKGIMFLV